MLWLVDVKCWCAVEAEAADEAAKLSHLHACYLGAKCFLFGVYV
jgi:hypothetical protein